MLGMWSGCALVQWSSPVYERDSEKYFVSDYIIIYAYNTETRGIY